jgi:AcrR family transcriptional regulator
VIKSPDQDLRSTKSGVAKTGSVRGNGRAALLRAALTTLGKRGFAATTSRAIAEEGGFNQSLVFYHFGTVEDLLLAAIDASTQDRLERYRAVIGESKSLSQLIGALQGLYSDDVASGHVAAVQELIAGASTSDKLRGAVQLRIDPWVKLAQEVIQRFLAGSPLEPLIPGRETAQAIVALYVGLESLTHLDGDRARGDALFAAGNNLAALFDQLFPSPDSAGRTNG